MQTSMVFSQRKWPGAGDVDDCWVVSGIQAVNVTAPWLRLVSVPAFRRAAGEPDVQGEANGGQLRDIRRGIRTLFPDYADLWDNAYGVTWDAFVAHALEHRPLSVAVRSSKLPTRLQFGFGGYHQITIAVKGDGTWLVANPLAEPYARWITVNPVELKPAVMAYGRAQAGASGAWYVVGPTDAEALERYHAIDDTTPFDQEDVDALTAAIAAERDALQGRIDRAVDDLTGDPIP